MFQTREHVVEWLRDLVDEHPTIDLASGERLAQIEIDQELASAVLKHLNTENPRKPRRAFSDRYASDMKEDRWKTNYDPLVFGESFLLYNGQHRLTAIAKGAPSQKFIVVIGAPEDSKKGQDLASPRNLTEVTGVTLEAGAVVTMMSILENGSSGGQITKSAKAEYYEAHRNVIDHCLRQTRRRPQTCRKGYVGAAFAIALHGAHDTSERAKIEELLEDLVSFKHAYEQTRILSDLVGGPGNAAESKRADTALRILRGIKGHVDGKPVRVASSVPGTAALQYFLPGAKWRQGGWGVGSRS